MTTRYKVYVQRTRTIVDHASLDVEADNREDAEAKASERVEDNDECVEWENPGYANSGEHSYAYDAEMVED